MKYKANDLELKIKFQKKMYQMFWKIINYF